MPGKKRAPASTPKTEEDSPPRGPRLRRRIQVSPDEDDDDSSQVKSQMPAPRASRNRRGDAVPSSSGSQARSERGPPTQKSQTQRGRRATQKSQQAHDDSDHFIGAGGQLTIDTMVSDSIYYALVMQGKLHPIRKSDLIKIGMNNQSMSYREVIDIVADQLRDVFGVKLVGMKNVGPGDDSAEKCHIWEATSFILISNYRQRVASLIADSCGNATGAKALSKDFAAAALMLILSTTYMLDRSMDEDSIWDILESMQMAYQLCKKREELRRFLKTEFVDTLYLSKHEDKSTDQIIIRYGWGFRAEMEISKYTMLKHVAEKILRKGVTDFPLQLSKFSPEEREQIDEQDDEERMECDNGSETSSDIEQVDVNENGSDSQSPPTQRQDNRSGTRTAAHSNSDTQLFDEDSDTQPIDDDSCTDSD